MDLTQAAHRERLAELIAFADTLQQVRVERGPAAVNRLSGYPDVGGWSLEIRESVLASLPADAQIITDDNMIPEWRFARRRIFEGIAWRTD